MGDKDYRSIGETLELIKEEFPEVTISKIRFLETQGLIAPERTTNGYRKFYEHDIERLAFVLRQQREQFLPLKVIKDRITETEPGVFVLDPNKGTFSGVQKKSPKFERDLFGEPLSDLSPTRPNRVRPRTDTNGAKSNIPERSVKVRQEKPQSDGKAIVAEAPSKNGSAATDRGAPRNEPLVGSRQYGTTDDFKASSPGNMMRADRPASAKRPRLFALPSTSSLAESLEDPHALNFRPEESPEGSELEGELVEDAFPKNSFTVREIAENADLTMVQVADLTTFGLLNPTSVRGQQIYSAADLELATLAREFAKFGLEARHLKMYRVSAEREASFLEQVVLPMLAKKSQKSRNRAEAALTQLGEIGAQFRTLLLERAIEKILKS